MEIFVSIIYFLLTLSFLLSIGALALLVTEL